MGSPKRGRRDQDKRGDIKNRLQALASKTSSETKKTTIGSRMTTTSRSQDSHRAVKDRIGNDKSAASRKDSVERILERSRTEGNNRWAKKLDEEAKDPERWGHSGFKELYKNELGMNKSRRSRSRDKTSNHRSKSRDRPNRLNNRNRDRIGVGEEQRSNNRGRKRSHSSSDRSPVRGRVVAEHRRRPGNEGLAAKLSIKTSLTKKTEDRRGDQLPKKKERLAKRSLSRSLSRQRDKSASAKKTHASKNKRGPISPPERSRSPSRSMISPALSDRSSSSSRSRSSVSSSSSSSDDSSSSSSSPSRQQRQRHAQKPRTPPSLSRSYKKKAEESVKLSDLRKTKLSAVKSSKPSLKKKPTHESNSDTSSNPSTSGTEEEMEDGEEDEEEIDDGGDGELLEGNPRKKSNPPIRMSLSERFGKLAQLSSQRRSHDPQLVQLRIVAPVGASTSEKNVSVDESKAAPVIFNVKPSRLRASDQVPVNHHHHHPLSQNHIHLHQEEPIRKEERTRDDRWRDWHERYDQYRHVQPPRQLPRDWDDINVRHKYYTERGYFGHDMSLEDLSRWEDWWHRYQTWRRGYESAWVEMHGPNVPVEYPIEYRSTQPREAAHPPISSATSIRSRLGWRR